ncbi:MAG TPA: hypothetical protein VGR62_08460 [Candidatus Binatia bacterium]|nr:hypothetical protein [Candidatus Binatia bacterium]
MIELGATRLTDSREWHRVMPDAASRGPTAIDETTGMVYVLRRRDIELLSNEPRMHGVGLSLSDPMRIAEGLGATDAGRDVRQRRRPTRPASASDQQGIYTTRSSGRGRLPSA